MVRSLYYCTITTLGTIINFIRLYDNLLANTQQSESFYFGDQVLDGVKYRVFSYRLASYSDFLRPAAAESRGIMFEIDAEQRPVRLACRPMHKFHNMNENPLTMNLDVSVANTAVIMDKADGSLISTFMHKGELRVKSKTSLFSDQVQMAMKLLKEDPALSAAVYNFTSSSCTVNMEYVGPDNRIVLGYAKPELRVMNVRDNVTGNYLFPPDLQHTGLQPYLVKTYTMQDGYIDAMKDEQGYEGYVVVLKNGTWFKLKTPWYLALHHTKDSINSNRRLFECIIQESSDDLKALFADDAVAMARICEFEGKIMPIYDHVVSVVETFFLLNKHLDRKSYAVLGQQTLARELFGLAMNLYVNKPVDYKEWAIKHREYFKITDEELAVVE